MMRSLWTGASGMIAQQTNVDTIAKNLVRETAIPARFAASASPPIAYNLRPKFVYSSTM